MELKRVVVTGLGAITPLGNDVASTWDAALAGKSGAAPITHFDASLFKTQFAAPSTSTPSMLSLLLKRLLPTVISKKLKILTAIA